MWLVNQFGRVLFITDIDAAKHNLAKGVQREATPAEIKAYKIERKQKLAEWSADATSSGIYYQTVRKSPDGYGMSRDLLKTNLFKIGCYLTENYHEQKVGLMYNYPYGLGAMRNDVRLLFTMFESTKIPDDWADHLEFADEIFVPSKFCQEVFKEAGFKSRVIPLGYNQEAFSFKQRGLAFKEDRPFTFIHYNSFNVRKGFSEVFNAFTKEFNFDEPVRLILKTSALSPSVPIMKSQYPNIDVVCGEYSEEDLQTLLESADCMVYPSMGEGFGITPLEAMATGLPCITVNAHGISEYFNPDVMMGVEYSEVPAMYNRFKGQDVGNMVQADEDDLRKQMRWAFSHQTEVLAMGQEASEYVKKYTYAETAKKLAPILNKWKTKEVKKRADSKYLDVEEV